jgi:sugar lactone lactonase YvrE
MTFQIAAPNALGVHSKGHILVATADSLEASPTGGVFALLRGEMQRLAGDYTVGNGSAFSPDGGTGYVADSLKGVIYAYDWEGISARGTIRSTVIDGSALIVITISTECSNGQL